MSDRREFIKTGMLAGGLFAYLNSTQVFSEEDPLHTTGSPDTSAQSDARNVPSVQSSTIVVDGLSPAAVSEESIAMCKAGGVNCWHRTMYGIESFSEVYTFLDSHKDSIVPVTTVREIRQARADGKIALVFGWQAALDLGMRMIEPLTPFGSSLRAYYQLGLRISGIAYNVTNIFGGGCLEPEVPLTRMGRRLVEEIHKTRILLDVGGHTGERTSFDAIAMSAGVPVICSHTNVAALFKHPRCISDGLMETIAKTNGVVGITSVNAFLGHHAQATDVDNLPRLGVDAFVDQLDYVRKLLGPDHVGIGPDFGQGRAAVWALRNLVVLPPDIFGDKFVVYAKDFENPSEFPNVTRALLERGWPTSDIQKILGGNWLRVYERVWGA